MYGDDLLKVSEPVLDGKYAFIIISAVEEKKVQEKSNTVKERLKQSGLTVITEEKLVLAKTHYLKLFYPAESLKLLRALYSSYK